MRERLSARSKIFLIILFLVMAGFCIYYFLLTPQVKASQELEKELAVSQAKLSSAQATAASLKSESARLDQVKEELEKINRLFLTEMRDGSDIILLGLRAALENIDITGVEPGKIKEKLCSLEMPLKISEQGNYRNLLAFCENIEGLGNLVEIRSLKVETLGSISPPSPAAGGSPGTDAPGTTSPGSVKATLEIMLTFAKNPQERLHLEEMTKWLTGRYNIFAPSATIAPVPELAGQIRLPVEAGIPAGENTGQNQDQDGGRAITTTGAVYGSSAQPAPEYIWRK